MRNRFLFPLITNVILFIVGAVSACAVAFVPAIIIAPMLFLLFWYEEKGEVKRY